MSILKLSKNDIYKNGEDDKKIKLSRSQISYDSAMVSDWETRNKQAYDALEKYRQRINSGGYLSADDLSSYRTALDSYVETSTGLRGISKAFGQGEMDDDNTWADTISQMETGYKGLSDYFSQWKTEADFKVAMEQAKANEQRMAELTNGYDPTKHQQEGKAGWEDYVAYQEQKVQKPESTLQEKQWWETLLGYLGDVGSDTSLPGVGGSQVLDMQAEAQRKEANKLRPDERWSDEQREIFGYLWNTERQKASEYAFAVNNVLNKQAEDAKIKEIQESATGNFFAGVGHTLGAIASAPLGLADYLGDLIYQGAVGYIPQADGEITPFEYSQAVTGGVSQHLNDVGGTLNENIPVIGGKGWGDVYGLGTSIAQSSLAAFAGGSGQALVTFFGSAAASGVDDALSRGASGAQAIAYGTLSGLAEGLAENIGVDNLMKIGASNTMRELAMNILKQGAAEGLEEGITTLMNNFADQLVLQDKSNFAALVHRHMLMGLSESDAKKQAWMDMANDLAFDMVGGFVSGAVHAAPQTAYQTYLTGNEMKTQYGGSQQELVGEALEINPDNAFAQKMQGRLDKGKNLTGMQVRNILASNQEQITTNDMKKIQKAAEARLTALGQTADVSKVAELATKWATGQELTRAEKRLLTTSQYGSRVANELLPSNIDSGKYSTEWAEEIGTRSVNAKSYNKKAIRTILDAMSSSEDPTTYKSLEDRVGGESSFGVSKSGQATIRETGEAISIDNVEVVGIDKGDMSLQVDGKEVKASDIDFADESQSYLFDAVSKIEHITPGAATAIIRDYNPTTGQTMGEYLNGIDEGYTYGYYGYSEADLKAGSFAPKLTSEQMMSAYKLGQSARKISDTSKTEAIKRMRTAVEAEAEKATANDVVVSKKEKTTQQKAKNLTVTYNKGGGKVVDIDKAGIKDAKRSGAVEVAKILHKMGLGTKVEFFSSYLSTDANGNEIRVFLDDNGVEQRAYSGVYRKSDGTIRIDLEAYNGRGLTLNALSHELTHFIQQWSAEKYQVLADFLIKSYEKTDMTMHERVLKEQARLEKIRGKEVSYDEAFDEVVANAMSKMFDDGKLVEKLTELRAEDESLARKLWEGFKKIMSKFLGIYENESALFKDAADLVEMKETFEQLQNMFAEALVEASENHQATQQIGLEIDTQTESVSPAVMNSEHTWTESDYVQERDKAAKEIAKAIGVSEKKAKDYIDSINSIAKMIAEDRSRLDYFSSPGRSSFVDNAEYGGSFDFSTLCKKRRLLTGTFTAIQKALPNTALTADEILDIRNRMKEANIEVSCGLCYVEGSRANMGQFAKEFLRLYKQYYPDAWQPNMADVNTPEGIEWVRINHPECYEQYEYFWNHYGTLKDGDKNLFASQQKPKLYQLHTEYKSEILQKFKGDDKVEDKNLNGGIRLQSFSDFEIVHLIDAMQIIMDMSRVGLAGQAYTKVPDFAWALGDTGLKINLSLIAKGVDAAGKLIFDDVEGMPIADAMKLRDRYSKNVGTILVAFNDEQLLAAMADDRVDFIIPFHRSQWKKSQYEAMGLPAKTKDYTFMQNEKYIKPQFHEYRGRMVKDKASNYMPNEYWDFSKSGKENAVAYLEMCARNNKRPKFYKLLQNNGDGSYSLKADGSTDGYWKLLIDFKMYDNEGVGSPQMAVKPEFNMEEANRMLNDYKGGHSTFPVAKGIVDSFVKDYKASHKGEQYSSQETDLDSDGRQLSKEQAEYFKDSKVRNENGRLKVMYHGTANGGFNTFDTYGGKYGLFGAGSYFTDSKDVAKKYTDKFNERGNDRKQVYETYLNITNPIDMDALANPDEWAKAFPEASFPESGTNEDFFRAMEEYFYDEMYFKWEAAEIAMESIEGMGYDGITHIGGGRVNPDGERHRVYIAFKPEQIKNVDNTTPTSDSDIRYSSHETDLDSDSRSYAEITEEQQKLYQREMQIKERKRIVENDPELLQAMDEVSDMFTEMRDLLPKRRNGTATQEELDRIEELKALRDERIQRVAKLQESLGLNAISQEESDLREKKEALRVAADAAWAREGADKENKAIEKAGVSAAEYFRKKALKAFKTTTNFNEAGYLLPDGTLLNFSGGERNHRYRDHREIGEIYEATQGTAALNRFLNDGNIRIMAESPGIDLASGVEPTKEQYAELRRFINTNGVKDGQFFVDFSGAKGENAGKYAYNGKIIADRIINDIKYFYQTGNVRESSGLTDFLYSEHETDSSNRSLLANAFEGITQNSNEYKLIQEYKGRIKLLNEYEAKLSDLNAEIRKILFESTGARDTARLEQLQAEAKRVAENINRNDKKLLSLEASEPLRKVIERERKKEATKTKDHVKEIQQNKKVRAEQTELRHKIRKAIRDLDKILNRGNKKLNVKEELQPVVTKALQAAEILFTDNYGNYDMLRNGLGVDLSDAEEALVNTFTKMLKDIDKMPTDSYEGWQARQEAENRLNIKMSKLKDVFARERKRLNNTTVSSILGELADAYATLNDSTLSYVQGAYSEPVYNFLKNLQSEVGGTIVKDMTKNQLEHIYAAYRMVLETVRNANKMFNEELKQSREQLGNAVIQEVREAGGVHLLGTKTGDAVSQFNWNNLKPIWVGDRIGSETFGRLMHGLFKGQYNFAKDIDEVRRFKLEMDSKYKPRDWDAEKLYAFESSTGKEFSLNLQQIMSLYAFSKREQAYSHLISGGFVFEENSTVIVEKNGIKKTYIHKGATSYKLNVATLNRIVNSLTAEQMAYVDEMQAYLSDVMGAKGNEVSMKLYGIEMFKEKFYFPLRSSGAYMEKAKEAEMKKEQGQINLVNSGFTHSVKPEAKNPIVLSGFMDVWAEHSNEMSMYHSMVLPMEDFRKVYNYTTIHDENYDSASVYQTIQDAYGKAATNYIDQLYRELNAGATVDPRETPYKKLISNFKKSAVMLSASVVVQQFSSVGRAWAVIDPKYFTGTKVNSDTKLSAVEEMKKYAPVAIIKEMGGFDTGTKGNAKAYIMAEQYGKGERLKGFVKDEQYRGDIMGILPAKADEKTWIAIWEAAKRETKANNPKIDVKSEEFLKLAGERFSECIEKTQVYDSVLARSANMRSKGGLMQMATAFMAEPTTTVNLLENAIRKGDAKHIARAFGSVAVSIVLNNALASIVYAMRDDDEDETLMEKYFQSLTSGLIDDINPMSYYPFLKDVYSLFQGYDVERTDMSVIADVRDALKKAVSLLGKDTSDMDDEELAAHYKQVNEVFMGILDAGCSAFGVPVKNIRRDASGLINAFVTAQKDLTERDNSWLSFWDKVGSAVKDTIPVLAWTKDKAKTDKLYDAIVSGDKAYLDRLKSTYKTDSAYQSAVRNALRENDSRIHDAAQARYDGNTEDYKRIFKEIQNEGRFSFDDIMSAIKSEESAIRKATKTTN